MEHTVFWPGWETVRLIGRGSFGAVYEIQRTLFDEVEKAALKVITIPQNASEIEELRSDGFDEESITSAFQNHLKSIVAEYSLMRKMNGCSNIVNCDDVRYVQHNDGIGWDIYIKMELLTPLTKALPDVIPEETVMKIATDLCSALELCKKYDIVHRDIKPQNIFVSDNGDYKLGDFGIAKTVEKTMGGTKIGTYKYMAPEVYHSQPYGSAADIYSLGLVLYWLLNERRMPFLPLPPTKLSAGMDEAARTRRLQGEPLPAPKHGSEELKHIVLKACAYDPKDRYKDAMQMQEDINRLTNGMTALAASEAEPKAEHPMEDDTVLDGMFQEKKASQGKCSIQSSVVRETSPKAQPANKQLRAAETQSAQSEKGTGGVYLKEQYSRAKKRVFVVLLLLVACGAAVAGWFIGSGILVANISTEEKPYEKDAPVSELPEKEQDSDQQTDADLNTSTNLPGADHQNENIVVAKAQINLYSSPRLGSRINAKVDADEEVEILRIEAVGSDCWAFIRSDKQDIIGWARTDMLDMSNVKLAYDDAITSGNTSSGTSTSTDTENIQALTETEEIVITEQPHVHSWVEATCTTPKTCHSCGEISGSALGHQWSEATCTTPKTCHSCGEISGSALGHQWSEATCTTPKTCSICGATTGGALGHQWAEATYDAPKTCKICGESVGDSLGYPLTWCQEVENSNNPNARYSVDIEVGTWKDKFGTQYHNAIKYWLSASLVATEYSVYDIGAKYSKLLLTAVNSEKNADGGENQVTVYADGTIIFQSDWIRNDSSATVVTLDVSGVNRLKIECTTISFSYCYCLVSGVLYK